jgi:high-affinity Fe2+/Pb2+ permease
MKWLPWVILFGVICAAVIVAAVIWYLSNLTMM